MRSGFPRDRVIGQDLGVRRVRRGKGKEGMWPGMTSRKEREGLGTSQSSWTGGRGQVRAAAVAA